MTTNAQQIGGRAFKLKQAGLDRVNISMDSLKPERFKEMCGGDLSLALNGIEETMAAGLTPMGILGQDKNLRVNNTDLMNARLLLISLTPRYPSQPSSDYQVDKYLGRVGFIRPHSQKFCHLCNRVRLMSDEKLRVCLGDNSEISILEALQSGEDEIEKVISEAIINKPMQHHFEKEFITNKDLSRIGG